MSLPGKKHKTGIPIITRDIRGEGEPLTHRTQPPHHTHPISSQSHPPPPPASQQQQSASHPGPLAKAMAAKKPQEKKKQNPETWADEKVDSISQKTRNQSLDEHRRRREDMEKQLKEAEAQLVTMTGLIEKREELLKEEQEEAKKKTSELEEKLIEKDGVMIKHGIDPVTGEEIPLTEDGKKKVEATKKFTKKRIQDMREKLQKMNSQTEHYLTDIENTMAYLGSLEVASENAGPYSDETRKLFREMGSEEDIIAKVYDENKPPTSGKAATERLSPSGEEDSVREENDEDEEEEENEQESKFFMTDNDAESTFHGKNDEDGGEDDVSKALI